MDSAAEELRARGAEIAIGPLTRNPGLRPAFIRGPEGAGYRKELRPTLATTLPNSTLDWADSIRDGKLVSPGFDAAVTRHRLLDAIVRASETGMKQVLQSALNQR